MRILFTTFAWPSHYYPMVPLAWACRAAGHEVRMASQPELRATILGSGLPGVIVGRDVDVVAHHQGQMRPGAPVRLPQPPSEWDEQRRRRAVKGFAMFVELALAMSDDLIAFARDWRPDLIVSDPLSYAGPVCAALLGVPAVRNLFGPDITLDLEYEALPPLLHRYGLDTVNILGDLTVDPCPPTLQLPSPALRHHMRYVPYSGLSAVPPWTLRPPDRPRVCLTWGTSTTRLSAQYTSVLPQVLGGLSGVDSIARGEVEVVLAVTETDRDLLGAVPDGVRVATGVALQQLLPTCSAVVHQGGAGTTLTSLLYGLPQIVVAQLADQLVNAGTLARAGAGECVIPDENLAETVRAGVTAALDQPGYRTAAAGLRREMLAAPTPLASVAVLEQVAARTES